MNEVQREAIREHLDDALSEMTEALLAKGELDRVEDLESSLWVGEVHSVLMHLTTLLFSLACLSRDCLSSSCRSRPNAKLNGFRASGVDLGKIETAVSIRPGLTMRCSRRQPPPSPVRPRSAVQAVVAAELCRWAARREQVGKQSIRPKSGCSFVAGEGKSEVLAVVFGWLSVSGGVPGAAQGSWRSRLCGMLRFAG